MSWWDRRRPELEPGNLVPLGTGHLRLCHLTTAASTWPIVAPPVLRSILTAFQLRLTLVPDSSVCQIKFSRARTWLAQFTTLLPAYELDSWISWVWEGKRSTWRLSLDLRQRERPEKWADPPPPPPAPHTHRINLITAYRNHSMKFWIYLRKSTYLLPKGTVSLSQGNRKHFKTHLLPDLF